MKLNVLVVAAMVVTSVNAAGKGGLLSCFGLSCGSGSGSSNNEPDEPQDPDTIKEDEDNGSNELEVDLERLCRDLMVDLQSSYDQMFDISYPIVVYKPPPKGLSNGLGSIKKHLTLQRQPTPEETEEKQQTVLSLKDKYRKDRKDFDANNCLVDYPYLLSQNKLDGMDNLFYYQ
ncbi:hypothetical protein BASA83_000896 [Batrachochytrium salamandrivorans]|nr:hypothetical protein BASA81_004336 [Batrachochytrium salamandrivorans]KAH9276761.1 hypothetical protein BASA83_000896 [Batrachochytrium salamandrivorans]